MNKRYIDFVPVDKKAAPKKDVGRPVSTSAIEVRKGAPRRVAKKPVKKPTVQEVEDIPLEEMFAVKKSPAGVSTGLKEQKFGIIEDYQPKFVRSEVSKRPLGAKKSVGTKKTLSDTTKTAVGVKKPVSPAKKPISSAKNPITPPRTKFVNLNKIEKRPLSRSVTPKKMPAPKVVAEKPEKPVVIIAKPERDSKAGLIIAIILTIILGAAAGTVAFLLLPK